MKLKYLPILLTATISITSAELTPRADLLMTEKLYGDALEIYKSQLPELPHRATELQLKIALCHLELCQPDQALSILKNIQVTHKSSVSEYLFSLALRQQGQHQQALDYWKAAPPFYPDEVALERGMVFYETQSYLEAEQEFKKIGWDPKKPNLYYLSHYYLVMGAINEHHYIDACLYLDALKEKLSSSNPFWIEVDYLEGYLAFIHENFALSADHFYKVINKESSPNRLKVPSYYYLQSLLREAESPKTSLERCLTLFNLAENILKNREIPLEDKGDLLLKSQFLLLKGQRSNDLNALQQAELILSQTPFQTRKHQFKAKLLAVNLLKHPSEKDQEIGALLGDPFLVEEEIGEIYFLKGKNLFDEGLRSTNDPEKLEDAPLLFHQAQEAFLQSYQTLSSSHSELPQRAFHYLILSYIHVGDQASLQQAWELCYPTLVDQIQNTPSTLHLPTLCLFSRIVTLLDDTSQSQLNKSRDLLLTLKLSPRPFKQTSLKTLALIEANQGRWNHAETYFLDCLKASQSEEKGEVLWWVSKCNCHLNNEEKSKLVLTQLINEFPNHTLAPQAYFHYYSFQNYLQGDKVAMKHLRKFPSLYPNTPLVISAHYLIGLDSKKDHYFEGRIIRKKDWIQAIDSFQQAEIIFDRMNEENKIPPQDYRYYMHLRYRAMLERAELNLLIAEASLLGKKQIYLEYAEGVLREMTQCLHEPTKRMRLNLFDRSHYPTIVQEADFLYAQTLIKRGRLLEAQLQLSSMLDHFNATSIQKGTILAKTWLEKGNLNKQGNEFPSAIRAFSEAEKACGTHLILNTDEILRLWIQQALCYKELHEYEEAMRLLSKVVNHEAISPIRTEAMYLRADIYSSQGKTELALKQLQAAAVKGGEWGIKAHDRLTKEYGHAISN